MKLLKTRFLLGNFCLVVSLTMGIGGTLTHALLGQSWDESSGHAIGSDDAYISFRYAENFLNGNGLVFNAGERVEGYSNFLYTLLISPALFFGRDVVYPTSIFINCLLLAFSLFAFWKYCKETLDENLANIGVMLLAFSPWVWLNAATGLETILILAITIGAWRSVESYYATKTEIAFVKLCLFSLLSVLSRVDGFILPFICAAYLFIKGCYRDGLKLALFLVSIMAVYTAFRLYYYDDVIANTFYAKVSGDPLVRITTGAIFYAKFSIKTGILLALIFGYFHLMRKDDETLVAKLSFAYLFTFVWAIYLIYIGGDVYNERFLVAVLPLAIFVVLAASRSLLRANLFLVCAAIVATPVYFVSKDGRFEYSLNKYDFWIELGKYIGKNYPDGSLAIDACGKVPFFAGIPTIDMLGLNDKHIGKSKPRTRGMPGHTKFDPEYVLSREPTLIAAWMNPNLDMGYGLKGALYLKDYELKYLVNSSRINLGEKNIVDVSDLPRSEVEGLIRGLHTYGVLQRRFLARPQ